MAQMRFTGEIEKDGDTFSIKVAITEIPSMASAQEIGKWLHDAVTAHFRTKGATLAPSRERSAPLILPH